MKTVKHEIKLEKSVKIILGVLAIGILLHAFPIINKGIFSKANAFTLPDTWEHAGQGPIYRVTLCDSKNRCGYTGK